MPPPIRVLIIDPDETSTDGYCRVLSGKRWRTDRARGLEDALAQVSHNTYQVAILDMSLADSVGPEAWQHLKRACPQLRGIMTTRSPVLHQSVNPRNADIFAYLLKPFRIEALPQLITTALNYGPEDLKAFSGEQWLDIHSPTAGSSRTVPPLVSNRTAIITVLVALFLAVALFVGSIGLASAAERTLPGDTLYPVKTSIEEMRLAVTFDHSARLSLLLDQAQTRLDEIQSLVEQQRPDQIPPTVTAFIEKNNQAVIEIATLTQYNQGVPSLLRSRVEFALSHSESVLEGLVQTVPDAAKPAIEHALAVSEANRSNAEEELSNGGNNGQGGRGNGDNSGNGNGPPMTPPGQSRTPGPPFTPPGQNSTPPGQDNTPGPPITPPGQTRTPGPPMTPPGQQNTPPGQDRTPPGQNRTPGPPPTHTPRPHGP